MQVERIYKALLELYPADYKDAFYSEMLRTFEKAAGEHRTHAFLRFVVSEFTSLLIGAVAEWIEKLTTDPVVRGRCLPDVRKMRPVGVPREVWFAAPKHGGH